MRYSGHMTKQNNESGDTRKAYEIVQDEIVKRKEEQVTVNAQVDEELYVHQLVRRDLRPGETYPPELAAEEAGLKAAKEEASGLILEKEKELMQLHGKSLANAEEEDRKHNRKKVLADVTALQSKLEKLDAEIDDRHSRLHGELRDVVVIARELETLLKKSPGSNGLEEARLAKLLVLGYERVKNAVTGTHMYESLKMKE